MTANDLAAIVTTARPPRRIGRGVESDETAARRGRTDIAIAGLLFHAGLRRSEVAALLAGDVEPAPNVVGATTAGLAAVTNSVVMRAAPPAAWCSHSSSPHNWMK